jgi:hypothetical protein
MPYLNITEVESALSVASSPPYNGFTQLITLPNASWEGRMAHAVRIGNRAAGRPSLCFLGGVHAREWGSPDILISSLNSFSSRNYSLTVDGMWRKNRRPAPPGSPARTGETKKRG